MEMKKFIWEERKNKEYWGQRNLDSEGFLHCSTIEYFWRIVWLFEEDDDEFDDIGDIEEYDPICIYHEKLVLSSKASVSNKYKIDNRYYHKILLKKKGRITPSSRKAVFL